MEPGANGSGCDQISAALFRDADEVFFTSLLLDEGEASLAVLEAAHLLELLLDSPPCLERDRHVLGRFLRLTLTGRVEKLQVSRYGLAYSLDVTGVEMAP